MQLPDKVAIGRYLVQKGGCSRDQQDQQTRCPARGPAADVRGREDALFAAVDDPGAASAVVRMLLESQPGEPGEVGKKSTNSSGHTVLTKLVTQLSHTSDPETIESIQGAMLMLCREAEMETGPIVPCLVQAAGHKVTVCTQMLDFFKKRLGDVVDFNATLGEMHQTAVHLAAAEGQHSIIRALLQSDADVDVADGQDDTPLILACRGGHIKTIAVLLAANANPNTRSTVDGTPLLAAVTSGQVAVVEELFRNNQCVDLDPGAVDADAAIDKAYWPIGINEPDADGCTALDLVIQAEQSGSPPPRECRNVQAAAGARCQDCQ